jgi:hypothetical protein
MEPLHIYIFPWGYAFDSISFFLNMFLHNPSLHLGSIVQWLSVKVMQQQAF